MTSLYEAREHFVTISLGQWSWPIQDTVESYEHWRIAFHQFNLASGALLSTNEAYRRSVMVLELYGLNLGMEIKVRAAGSGPLAWDDHQQGFCALVDTITHLRKHADDSKAAADENVPPLFHLSMGEVGLLSSVVLRCRDPALRRRTAC